MAGLTRDAEARATCLANLAWAADRAGAQGLTIEPINGRDMPGYPLSGISDALRVILRVGAPDLGLQFDVYHAQITGVI